MKRFAVSVTGRGADHGGTTTVASTSTSMPSRGTTGRGHEESQPRFARGGRRARGTPRCGAESPPHLEGCHRRRRARGHHPRSHMSGEGPAINVQGKPTRCRGWSRGGRAPARTRTGWISSCRSAWRATRAKRRTARPCCPPSRRSLLRTGTMTRAAARGVLGADLRSASTRAGRRPLRAAVHLTSAEAGAASRGAGGAW